MDEYAFARDMLRRDIAARESLQRFRQERAAAATGGLPRRDDAPRYAPGAIAGAEPAPSPRAPRHVHWSQAPDCRRGGNVRRLIMQEAHTLAPEPVQWLWRGRLAAGKLALIGGAAGSGKSNLVANLVGTVTSGGLWPCGEGRAPRGHAIVLSAEDGERETLLPRLMAANADLSRVSIMSSVGIGVTRRAFSLRTDLDLLEDAIRAAPELRLITIDPISSYLGGAGGHGNERVRELLDPLAMMAAHHRVAVVAVTHPPKGNSLDPSEHFIGSIAFNAAARASFLLRPDPDDAGRRLFLQVKNNLGLDPGTLAFRVVECEVAPGIATSAIAWEERRLAVTVRDLLAQRSGQSLAKIEAEHFLRELLAAGAAAPVADIEHAARAAGLLRAGQPISQCKAVREARASLGLVVKRRGFGTGARYTWALPRPRSGYKDRPAVGPGRKSE